MFYKFLCRYIYTHTHTYVYIKYFYLFIDKCGDVQTLYAQVKC